MGKNLFQTTEYSWCSEDNIKDSLGYCEDNLVFTDFEACIASSTFDSKGA